MSYIKNIMNGTLTQMITVFLCWVCTVHAVLHYETILFLYNTFNFCITLDPYSSLSPHTLSSSPILIRVLWMQVKVSICKQSAKTKNNMQNQWDVQEAEENILTFAPLTPLQSHPPHEDPEHPPCKKENVKFHTEPLGGSKHMKLAFVTGS